MGGRAHLRADHAQPKDEPRLYEFLAETTEALIVHVFCMIRSMPKRSAKGSAARSLLGHPLILQCHFNLGYELSASLAVPERFHYPLPEAFLAPLAVASVHRPPWPELLFGQIPPRNTGCEDPKHPGEYLTMIASGPSRGRLLWRH